MESEATNTVPLWLHRVLTYYLKELPFGAFLLKDQKLALGVGLSQSDKKKASEFASSEGKGKCLATEVAGESEKSDDGISAINVESNMDAESAEATEDVSI